MQRTSSPSACMPLGEPDLSCGGDSCKKGEGEFGSRSGVMAAVGRDRWLQVSRPRFVVGLLVVALTAAFAFAQPARADDPPTGGGTATATPTPPPANETPPAPGAEPSTPTGGGGSSDTGTAGNGTAGTDTAGSSTAGTATSDPATAGAATADPATPAATQEPAAGTSSTPADRDSCKENCPDTKPTPSAATSTAGSPTEAAPATASAQPTAAPQVPPTPSAASGVVSIASTAVVDTAPSTDGVVTIPVPSTDGETPADSTQPVVEAAPSLSQELPPVVMSPADLAGVQAGTTRTRPDPYDQTGVCAADRLVRSPDRPPCPRRVLQRPQGKGSERRARGRRDDRLVVVGRRPARGRTCGRPDAGSPARAGHEGEDQHRVPDAVSPFGPTRTHSPWGAGGGSSGGGWFSAEPPRMFAVILGPLRMPVPGTRPVFVQRDRIVHGELGVSLPERPG